MKPSVGTENAHETGPLSEIRESRPAGSDERPENLLESDREKIEKVAAREERFAAGARERARGLMSKLGKNRKVLAAVAAAELLHLGTIGFLWSKKTSTENYATFLREETGPVVDERSAEFLEKRNGTLSIESIGLLAGGSPQIFRNDFGVDKEGFRAAKAPFFTKRTIPRSVTVTFDSTASFSADSGQPSEGYRSITGPDGKRLLVRQKKIGDRSVTEVIAEAPEPFRREPLSQEYSSGLDLSAVGGPKMENLIRGEAMAPLARVGSESSYDLYAASDNPEGTLEAFERKSSTATAGIEEAEKLFGLSAGQAVKDIIVVPEGSMMNALSTGSTVVLSENWLKSETKMLGDSVTVDDRTLKTVAKHEGLHSVDARFGRRFSNGLLPVMRAFPEGLLKKLNESAFIGTSLGGHAQENAFEFFASLTNALTSDRWAESTAKLDAGERKLLLDSLVVLDTSISSTEAEFGKLYEKRDEKAGFSGTRTFPDLKRSPIVRALHDAIDGLSKESGNATLAVK